MEYDAADLWLGTPVDVDDDTWRAIKYDDGAVQFIHREDRTQIWQDRTVVSTKAGRGRAEAHYIEDNDTVLLALANNNRSPPEHGTVLDATTLPSDWEAISDEAQDGILWLLLVEWVESVGYVVTVPLTDEMVDAADDALDDDTQAEGDFEAATFQEKVKHGIEAYRNGAKRYAR